MNRILSLFILTLFYSPAHATLVKYCTCEAVNPDGGVLYSYGTYTVSGTGTQSEVCRDSCVDKINAEALTQDSWNGSWQNTTTICGWTSNNTYTIRAHSKIGVAGAELYTVAIPSGYSCYGEPCPKSNYFPPQDYFVYTHGIDPPLFTPNNVAIMVKDGEYPLPTGLETTTASGCPGYLKTHYKCVYHRAYAGADVCFGVNPPAYAVGATLVAEDETAASCPPVGYPLNVTLMQDVMAPYYGTGKPSNLDRCM